MSDAMDKCDEDIRLHVPSELKDQLFRLAEAEDRTLSDYVRHVLTLHAFGHVQFFLSAKEGTGRKQQGT